MFKVLDGSAGNVLGVEISGGYTQEDLGVFTKAFEDALGENDKINLLCKVDEMSVAGSEFKALWNDSVYALKKLDKFRHVAVVGHSKVLKVLIDLDNALLGKKSEERIEKYFDVEEMDKAWEFVRS